jgi:hypothetical protein
MYYVVVEYRDGRSFNRYVGRDFKEAEMVAQNRYRSRSEDGRLYIEQWYPGGRSFVQFWEINDYYLSRMD